VIGKWQKKECNNKVLSTQARRKKKGGTNRWAVRGGEKKGKRCKNPETPE